MSIESTQLDTHRGGIISNFSVIEVIIDEFITHTFIKSHEGAINFINTVLEDRFFSFELKKNIFYKIIKSSYKEINKTFPKGKLEQLQKIRNTVAHGKITVDASSNFNNIDKMYFIHEGKKYPARDLITSYHNLSKDVLKALLNLPGIEDKFLSE